MVSRKAFPEFSVSHFTRAFGAKNLVWAMVEKMGRNGFYISTDCFLDGFVDGSCCSCGGAIFGSADVGVIVVDMNISGLG